jgi:hypothetical protein
MTSLDTTGTSLDTTVTRGDSSLLGVRQGTASGSLQDEKFIRKENFYHIKVCRAFLFIWIVRLDEVK